MDPASSRELVAEADPTSVLYASLLSTVQDYLSDHELAIRKAAVEVVRSVSTTSVYCKVIMQQIAWWLQSDKPSDQRTALTDMVALAFPASPLLEAILSLLEHDNGRVRQAAVTCLHQHVVEVSTADEQANNFLDMISNVKVYIAQVFADIMMHDMRAPALDMFTEVHEDAQTKIAAFTLHFHSAHITHASVCNAVLALDHESIELVEAALRYLTMAALCSASHMSRTPAVSAISGCVFSFLPSLHQYCSDSAWLAALLQDAQGTTGLKKILIQQAVALVAKCTSLDLLSACIVLLTDEQASVRMEAVTMFELYFDVRVGPADQSQPGVAPSQPLSLKHQLIDMFKCVSCHSTTLHSMLICLCEYRSELVNSEDIKSKERVLRSIATLRLTSNTLESILITFIAHPNTSIKTLTLTALAALRVYSPAVCLHSIAQ